MQKDLSDIKKDIAAIRNRGQAKVEFSPTHRILNKSINILISRPRKPR